jgi:non-ribosomal peptide synthetase component F
MDSQYSFQQLDQVSRKSANLLLQRSFDPDRPVAVLSSHRSEMIGMILGVLLAGGFYVPLDPNLPRARISKIISDTQPGIILASSEQFRSAQQVGSSEAVILCADKELEDPTQDRHFPTVSADSPACLLYTSGSTGIPKGVILSHKTILMRALRYTEDFHLGPGDAVSLLQSIAVSAGVRDIFGALLRGATLELYDIRMKGIGLLSS